MTTSAIYRVAIFTANHPTLHSRLTHAGTQLLDQHLRALSNALGRHMPTVQLDVVWPPAETSPSLALAQLDAHLLRDLRVVLFSSGSPSSIAAVAAAAGCSHLVVATPPDSHKAGWSPLGNGVVHVACSPDRWPILLCDVGLDIALFHSYRTSRSYDSSPAMRQTFSRMKARYILQRGVSSYYGPAAMDVTYLPLGLRCHSGGGVDTHKLAKEWRQFCQGLPRVRQPAPQPDPSSPYFQIAQTLHSQYPHPTQLSFRAVYSRVDGLAKGHYLLIRAMSTIRRARATQAISFAVPAFRIGAVRILPYDRLSSLVSYIERGYVWVRPFEVP